MSWKAHLRVAWFLLRHRRHKVRAYWTPSIWPSRLQVGYKCLPCSTTDKISAIVIAVTGA